MAGCDRQSLRSFRVACATAIRCGRPAAGRRGAFGVCRSSLGGERPTTALYQRRHTDRGCALPGSRWSLCRRARGSDRTGTGRYHALRRQRRRPTHSCRQTDQTRYIGARRHSDFAERYGITPGRYKVRRVAVLSALVTIGALSAVVAAYQQPAGDKPKVIEVEKLKDNLFVLRGAGGGGNTGVFVTSTGVVVVDTKNPGWGTPILAKIKELTDKPVTMIINTHTHGDHVSGNVEFPATVDVVTHANTATNMKTMRTQAGTNIF